MSTIFLDPVQMDATAGHVGEHVNELTGLAADLETACSAAVPASIAVWLAEELHEITVTVRMIALVYSLAALDTAQRAQQIQADQSLATAAPTLASTSPTFTSATVLGGFSSYGSLVTGPDYTGGSPLVGGSTPFATSTATGGFTGSASIVGGLVLAPSTPSPGAVERRMASSADFAAQNAPWGASALSGSGGSSGLPIFDIPGYASTNRMLLSTPGRTYLGGGIYEGSGRTGSFHSVLPDPGRDY
jgi:hypothetical protein